MVADIWFSSSPPASPHTPIFLLFGFEWSLQNQPPYLVLNKLFASFNQYGGAIHLVAGTWTVCRAASAYILQLLLKHNGISCRSQCSGWEVLDSCLMSKFMHEMEQKLKQRDIYTWICAQLSASSFQIYNHRRWNNRGGIPFRQTFHCYQCHRIKDEVPTCALLTVLRWATRIRRLEKT